MLFTQYFPLVLASKWPNWHPWKDHELRQERRKRKTNFLPPRAKSSQVRVDKLILLGAQDDDDTNRDRKTLSLEASGKRLLFFHELPLLPRCWVLLWWMGERKERGDNGDRNAFSRCFRTKTGIQRAIHGCGLEKEGILAPSLQREEGKGAYSKSFEKGKS